MEMADKWNRHEIIVNEHMVAFVEVPPQSQAVVFMTVYPMLFFGCCPCLLET
jgi:hypothetical protein